MLYQICNGTVAFAEKTVTFGGTGRISDETVAKIIPAEEEEEPEEPEEPESGEGEGEGEKE